MSKNIEVQATCQSPSASGETCIMPSYSEMSIKDSEYSNYGSSFSFFVPWYNPCELNYICNTYTIDYSDSRTNGNCERIRSQTAGTNVSNPMLCQSGIIQRNSSTLFTCVEGGENVTNCKVYDNSTENGDFGCVNTSKGTTWKGNNEITNAFNLWIEEVEKKNKSNNDFILEAYRYTRNKKSVNEKFFRYTHFGWIGDADECAFDYMWKNNGDSWIKLSFFVFVFVLFI